MMIILTLLSETSKRSFETDRCNSEINRELIYTLFIFIFQFSGSKYNYSAAHLGSPRGTLVCRGTPVAEHCVITMCYTLTSIELDASVLVAIICLSNHQTKSNQRYYFVTIAFCKFVKTIQNLMK